MSNFDDLIKNNKANIENVERKERVYLSGKDFNNGEKDLHIVDFNHSRKLFADEDCRLKGKILHCMSFDSVTGYLKSDVERANPIDCATCSRNPKNMAKYTGEGDDPRAKCTYYINLICDQGDDKETIVSVNGNDSYYKPDKTKPGYYVGTTKFLANYATELANKGLRVEDVTTIVSRETYGSARPLNFRLGGVGVYILTEEENDYLDYVSSIVKRESKKGSVFTEDVVAEMIREADDAPQSIIDDEDRLKFFVTKVLA